MKKLLYLALAMTFGGAFLPVFAAALPIPIDVAWPRFSFPPDFLIVAARAQWTELLAPALAAAVIGLVMRKSGAAAILLALANPLVLYALMLGPSASLALAAAALLLHAVLTLAIERDHGATVWLGLAAALAPLISNSVLALYPALLLFTPALSPWGAEPRRLLGFVTAVFAPFAMTSLAILYLYWLLGPPEAIAEVSGSYAAKREIFLLLAGAALTAGAASLRSLWSGTGAFAAGAAILAAARPDLLASLGEVLR